MTSVAVYSYTHSVTYVADNILKSIKDIIRLSGLDPSKFMGGWDSNLKAIKTWIDSGHLEKVTLEIFHPSTDELIVRWDIEIAYEYSSDNGNFWTDTDQLNFHIRKAGVAPSNASYSLILYNKHGRPNVDGWETCEARSLNGMVKQSLGATVNHSGLSANTGYWRKT